MTKNTPNPKNQNELNQNELKLVKDMQAVCAQMVEDDILENPGCCQEFFDCNCCGKYKNLAGSIQYGEHRLCNDCVLYAEIGFKLKRIKNIDELIEKMEDERLGEICEFIKDDTQKALERLAQIENN